jgi:hypothetical protein
MVVYQQMPLFFLVALKDSTPAVDAAVPSHYADSAYKIEPGKWIINADVTTSRELTVKLGLRETASHFALPVRGYTGRAQPDLWEWLSAQSTRVDA